MPYPWAGSSDRIWRISMSSVPCGIGKRGEGIDTSSFYRSAYNQIGRRSRRSLGVAGVSDWGFSLKRWLAVRLLFVFESDEAEPRFAEIGRPLQPLPYG